MKVDDIDKINIDINSVDQLFDLTTATFEMSNDVPVFGYTVTNFEEMRIDLVCNNIYGNVNHVDFLLDVNNIINPMNILINDVIIYVDESQISRFRPSPEQVENVKAQFLNLSKKKRVDNNRTKKKEEKVAMPPTINTTKVNPVKISGNTIIIGDGLFN